MNLRIIDDVRPVSPGERVTVDLEVRNDGVRVRRAHVRVVGSGSLVVEGAGRTPPIEPGSTVRAAVELVVPPGLSPGEHRIGIEATAEDGSSALAHLTLTLASAAQVALSISPGTVQGRRGGRFNIDLINRGDETAVLRLDAEGDGLRFTIRPDEVELAPGERVRLRGRASRQIDRTLRRPLAATAERLFTVTAQGHSTPVRATAVFAPRSMVPVGARKLTAIVVAMAVWAASLATGLDYLDQRALNEARAEEQALRQEVTASAAAALAAGDPDELAFTDGDGGDDAEDGEDAEAPDPTAVDLGGVVDLGAGDDRSGVAVTLRPVSLTNLDVASTTTNGAGGSGRGKVSAMHAGPRPRVGLLDPRATTTNEEGTWAFANVEAPGQYELRFAKAGFETQSHLVSVDEGDEPLELDVVLEAGDGVLGGTVTSGGQPVGGASVTITDGTVTYTTSTATTGDVGRWSVKGLATPARYLVSISRRGFGTETRALELVAGGEVAAIATTLTPGVGSIAGSIRYLGQPVGAVTITATDGAITRRTSSLTEADIGSFLLPQLPIPGTYTLTVTADGFLSQTLDVVVDGNETDAVIQLVSDTAIVTGTVTDPDGQPLSGVAVTASDGVRTYKTTSAIEPAGSYELTGMVPGSYVVGFDRFEYQPASALVTVAAGDVRILDPDLEARDAPQVVSQASVSVSPEDAGVVVTGATVRLQGANTYTTSAMGPDNRYTLAGLPVGTYVLTVSHPSYQTVIQTVRLGPRTAVERTVALQALGDLFGVVTDLDGLPVVGATVIVSFASTDSNGNPTTSSLDPLFTDVDGEYSVARSLASRSYTVTFSAPGYMTATRTFTGQTGMSSELNVSLFSQPRIAGVVRYRNDSGVPVALTGVSGVNVEFRPAGSPDPWEQVAVSTTNGSYEIPNTALTVGSWELRVTGLPDLYAGPTSMPDTANLVLNEERNADIMVPVNPSLSGTVRVLDPDGILVPLASATLQAERLVDVGNDTWAAQGAGVQTNGAGQYSIPATDLVAGTWRLRVTDVGAGHRNTVTPSFTLQVDTRATTDVQVEANPQVAVTVRDANNSPLAGVTVGYELLDPLDNLLVLDSGSAVTNASGVARLTKSQLVPGRYRFTVTGPPGLQDDLVFANQDLVVNQVLALTGVLYPDPTVDGFVRRLNSSNTFVGVSGRTVTIERVADDVTVDTTTSGAGGYFSFDPDALDPGDYRVVLGADERTVTVAGLANNDARSVELIVPQSSTVSGTLHWIDAAGQRIDLAGATAWTVYAADVITDHTDSTPAVVEVRGSLSAAGTGPAWSVWGQASGTADYVVSMDDGSFADATIPVTVTPGTDPAGVDVELSPLPATVSGQVNADGAPLAGVTVTLDPGGTGAVRTALSDGAGAWGLNDLVPGTYSVTVARPGYQSAVQPGPVTVGPAGSAVAGTGELNELRTVTVTVERSPGGGGGPLSGATVALSGGPFAHSEPTPGTHVFTGVPEGTYSVTVTRSGHAVTNAGGAIVAVPDVTVAWGADPAPTVVTMSANPTVVGALEGVTAGETSPLIGYTVTATLQGGSGPGSTRDAVTQSPDGGFTFADLGPGTWDVTVAAPGFVAPTIAPLVLTWDSGTTDLGSISLDAELGSITLQVHSDNFSPTQPIEGATAELRLAGSSILLASVTTAEAQPGDPAAATFTDLDAGTYSITMAAAGHADYTIQFALGRGEHVTVPTTGTVLAANSGGIVGTIEWRRQGSASADGPFTGATIVVSKGNDEVARINQSPSANYSILLLKNGSYTVTVSGVGVTTAQTSVNVGAGQVTTRNFVLVAQPVAVNASVRDDTGAALSGVSLQLAGFGGYAATSSGSGAASFPAVEPDTAAYTLTATLADHDPATTTVTVGPGGAVTVPPLTLNRQGVANVTVENDLGEPVTNATVVLTADPAHVAVYDPVDGHYELTELPAGVAHGLTITAPDHDTTTATTATVTPGSSQEVGPVVLVRSTGDLQVDVVDGSAAALAGARIEVRDGSNTLVATRDPAGVSETFADLVVLEGPYSVTASAEHRSTDTDSAAVTAAGSVTLTLTLQHRPTLEVTVGADPAGPADPTVTVSLRRADDGTFTGALTHSTATSFLFDDLEPGAYDGYRVVSSAAGYHPVNEVVTMSITEGHVADASVSLVALGTIEVTVDDGTDPITDATVTLSSATLGGTVGTSSTGSPGGVYTFTGLAAAGDYEVTVTRTGYGTESASPLVITDAGSTPVTVAVTVTANP